MVSKVGSVWVVAVTSVVASMTGFHPAVAASVTALPEITVTVRKREESLIEVPMSVAAITASDIDQAGITDIFDIAAFTPNLAYQDFGNGQLGIPTIRGLGQTNIFDEKNVGIFVNGIYISDENAFDVAMLDIARVEIARGPQSSLYGRNSFAGAINYVSAKPGDSLAGKVALNFGTDELLEFTGSVGGPVLKDLLGVQVAVGVKTFDGTYDNPADPKDNLQGRDTFNTSVTAVLTPAENFTATWYGYYNNDDNEQTANILLANNCGSFRTTGEFAYFCGDLPTARGSELGVDGRGISPRAYGAQREAWITSLDLEWVINSITLTSLTGYVDSKNDMLFDADYSNGYPFSIGPIVTPGVRPPTQTDVLITDEYQGFDNKTKDWSEEIRASLDGGRYRVMVGGFYYHHELDRQALLGVDNSDMPDGFSFTNPGAYLLQTSDPFNNPVFTQGTIQKSEDKSLFAMVSFDITEHLTATAEGRQTWEEKKIERLASPIFGPGSKDKEDWDFFTPRLTVDYKWTDDLRTYVSAAKGVHAGGFNSSFDASQPQESKFDPDTNWTYEVGVKGAFAPYEGALVDISLAAFYVDWKDIQIATVSEGGGITNPIRNVGDAEVKGFEIQINSILSQYFNLNLGYGYADPKLTKGSESRLSDFCGPDICEFDPETGLVDIKDNQLGRTYKNMFNGTAVVHGPLTVVPLGSDWEWYTRADVSYLSEAPARLLNKQFVPSRTLVNARAAIENGKTELAIWGRNIFDEEYVTGSSAEPRQTNSDGAALFSMRTTAAFQGDGRTLGISLSQRF